MKTEEFIIKNADRTHVRIQWIIITIKRDEGQSQQALIADIVKAVRKEEEK